MINNTLSRFVAFEWLTHFGECPKPVPVVIDADKRVIAQCISISVPRIDASP